MKKIFTFMMLSIFAVMNVNAAEETLWEGDWYVTWNGTDGHNEWGSYNADATKNQDFTWAFEVGAKINVYLVANDMKDASGEVYHKAQFDDWGWTALPGLAAVEFSGNKTVTIDVTQDLATAVAAKGFRIHGHGFNVVKLTKGEIESGSETIVIDDLAAAVLWTGEQEINGWGAKSMVLNDENDAFTVFTEKLTQACNLYFLVENATGGDFRIAGAWDSWDKTAYPSDQYNHMQALDADNVVKVTLTQEFVQQAFIEKGGIAFWGNGGFKIKAIGTTKSAILNPTGINTVAAVKNDNLYYNLNGQLVTNPTKGLYIFNGKKVILK